jgi:branched-chain amino acid transport system permease protein
MGVALEGPVAVLAFSSKFISLSAAGISQGAIVALAALGFLLVYKATGVVNFAQGDLITLGAYLAVWLVRDFDAPIVPAYLGAIALMFVIGVLIERVAYAPLRGRSIHVVVIATLGAAIVIRTVIALWLGSSPVALDSPVRGKLWRVGGAAIPYQRVVIVVVTLLVVAALTWLFGSTAFGRQVRALAADRETARLHGVRSARLSMIAFGLSAAIAGLAGVLIGPANSSFDITLGFSVMLGGFAAAILGGFGSLGGVVIGGFLIGLVEQLFGGYVLRDYRGAYPFVLMILVIALRPQGLLSGRAAHERL